ncbi:MAG: TIGR00725 family protein [Firmicutes bacterium]|nr:TIGR00725 family protein [Bacillota bacterium]
MHEGKVSAGASRTGGSGIRVGIIGPSGSISREVAEAAEAAGREVAGGGAILLTGGRDGVMEAASRGAKTAGGLTVGILPGDSAEEGNAYLDVPITTGLGFDFRSTILVHSSDVIIMIGGANGTFGELSTAYLNSKPVVVLENTGGWADRLKDAAYEGCYLDERRNVKIHYAKTPEEAVKLALLLAFSQRSKQAVV